MEPFLAKNIKHIEIDAYIQKKFNLSNERLIVKFVYAVLKYVNNYCRIVELFKFRNGRGPQLKHKSLEWTVIDSFLNRLLITPNRLFKCF